MKKFLGARFKISLKRDFLSSSSPSDLPCLAIWDEEGQLLRLAFSYEWKKSYFKRIFRYLGQGELKEAPLSWIASLKGVLKEYFEQKTFTPSYPYLLLGSPFEKRVWKTVSQIPYGETRSYSWVAQRIGQPKAFRAVGRALAANPLPLFVPCHRIVASRGLGGFSGGLFLKAYLLRLEAEISPSLRQESDVSS